MQLNKLLARSILAMSLSTITFAISNPISNDKLDTTQKAQIEKIVHDYIVHNPTVLIEASQNLEKQQQQAMLDNAQVAIKNNSNQIVNDKLTAIGNPKGNVTLVEFFDYQCIHCKKMAVILNDLIKTNNNLRIIYKEFPIFGKSSETASKAALSAGLQNKYQAMHDELLMQSKPLTMRVINATAKKIGLNMTKFKRDLNSKIVNDELDATRQLAESLHLMGTPAFIIAATENNKIVDIQSVKFIPGAITVASLQNMIKNIVNSKH